MRRPGRAFPLGLEGRRGTWTCYRDAGLFFIICCKSQKPKARRFRNWLQ